MTERGGIARLSGRWVQKLARSAISEAAAGDLGIFELHNVGELITGIPTEYRDNDGRHPFQWVVDGLQGFGGAFSALVYPSFELDGNARYQVTVCEEAEAHAHLPKCISEKGHAPELPVIKRASDGDRLNYLIVEGTKQARAAAIYAPDSWTVLMIAGIRGWSRDGCPTRYLYGVPQDARVLIAPDGDAATNYDVYTGALDLGDALVSAGVAKVMYLHLGGVTGKAGLDDWLGRMPEARRAAILESHLSWSTPPKGAHSTRPASVKPKPRRGRRGALPALPIEAPDDRPHINVNGEHAQVIKGLVSALLEGPYGPQLVSLDGQWGVARTEKTGASRLEVLDRGALSGMLSTSCLMMDQDEDPDGERIPRPADPSAFVMSAVMAAHRSAPEVRGVVDFPVFRADGSLISEPGYDVESGLWASWSGAVELAEHLTQEDARAAAHRLYYLVREFPFEAAADRAGWLAYALSALVREMTGLVPMTIIDATDAGSGKTWLCDTPWMILTGRAAPAMRTVPDDVEMDKRLTSLLVQGASLLHLEEAHELGGTALPHFLTGETWQGRLLGASKLVSLPNRAVCVATGNSVQVHGDLIRRIHRIHLSPGRPGYSQERHSFDYREYLAEHRTELLNALLTLVAAWVSAGQPDGDTACPSIGSFEGWVRVMNGILTYAGVPGFLDSLASFKAKADPFADRWARHLETLLTLSHANSFTVAQAVKWLDAEVDPAMPPDLADLDLAARGAGAKLAGQWRSIEGSWRGDFKIVMLTDRDRSNVAKYRVEVHVPSTGAGAETDYGDSETDLSAIAPPHRPRNELEALGLLGAPSIAEMLGSPVAEPARCMECEALMEPEPEAPAWLRCSDTRCRTRAWGKGVA